MGKHRSAGEEVSGAVNTAFRREERDSNSIDYNKLNTIEVE